MTTRAWYLVHSKPRQEDTALANLERQGYQAFLPRMRRQVRHAGRWRERVEALFPRYLFVCLDADNENWAPIHSTVGVSCLVRFDRRPARVPDSLVEDLRERADDAGIVSLDAPADFQPGQVVRVTQGPLVGIQGVVTATSGRQRVDVLLAVVGQATTARLSLHDLAPANP